MVDKKKWKIFFLHSDTICKWDIQASFLFEILSSNRKAPNFLHFCVISIGYVSIIGLFGFKIWINLQFWFIPASIFDLFLVYFHLRIILEHFRGIFCPGPFFVFGYHFVKWDIQASFELLRCFYQSSKGCATNACNFRFHDPIFFGHHFSQHLPSSSSKCQFRLPSFLGFCRSSQKVESFDTKKITDIWHTWKKDR